MTRSYWIKRGWRRGSNSWIALARGMHSFFLQHSHLQEYLCTLQLRREKVFKWKHIMRVVASMSLSPFWLSTDFYQDMLPVDFVIVVDNAFAISFQRISLSLEIAIQRTEVLNLASSMM